MIICNKLSILYIFYDFTKNTSVWFKNTKWFSNLFRFFMLKNLESYFCGDWAERKAYESYLEDKCKMY